MIVRLAPCLLFLAASPAVAQVCEQERLDLPPAIADAVRPYVLCGMISHADGDTPVALNGTSVSMHGTPSGPAACARIRAKAALEADQELQATMPERGAREAYIETVLQDADRFIAVAYASDAIGVDPAERLPACPIDRTRTSNAADQ
jgi:hypothetical protein